MRPGHRRRAVQRISRISRISRPGGL